MTSERKKALEELENIGRMTAHVSIKFHDENGKRQVDNKTACVNEYKGFEIVRSFIESVEIHSKDQKAVLNLLNELQKDYAFLSYPSQLNGYEKKFSQIRSFIESVLEKDATLEIVKRNLDNTLLAISMHENLREHASEDKNIPAFRFERETLIGLYEVSKAYQDIIREAEGEKK